MTEENTTSFLDSLDDTALFDQLDKLASGGQELDIPEAAEEPKVEEVVEQSSDTPTQEAVEEVTPEEPIEESIDVNENGEVVADVQDTTEDNSSIATEQQYSTEEYEELKAFKAMFDGTVKVGGVDVPIVDQPDKIKEMQKSYFDMKGKVSRMQDVEPVYTSLKDSGLLNDPTKLTLAIEASKGNPDAIKMLMKQNDIDPLTMDLENIKEENVINKIDEYVDNEGTVALRNIYESSVSRGVEDKFLSDVVKTWDESSLSELTNNPENADVILQHLESGDFTKISEEMKVQERLDMSDKYSKMSNFDKYLSANQTLYDRAVADARQTELAAIAERNINTPVPTPTAEVSTQETTPEVVVEQNERILAAQKASASASVRAEPNTGSGSLEDLNDVEFMEAMSNMITN